MSGTKLRPWLSLRYTWDAFFNRTADARTPVFDALVESKSGLITPKELSSRRDGILNVDGDGSFNELKFRLGLYKSRGIIIASWFMFGKGNFVWILVFVQFLHDARPDLFPTPKDLDLFKIFAIL